MRTVTMTWPDGQWRERVGIDVIEALITGLVNWKRDLPDQIDLSGGADTVALELIKGPNVYKPTTGVRT